MKTVLICIFSGILMLSVAAAQQAASAPSPPQAGATSPQGGAVTRVASGSVIAVSLSKTVDAKKAKAGEEVAARVTQDVKSNSGEVLVPKDTRVMGHITAVQARSKEQKESQLGIVFEHAVMKNGSEMALPMSIQAIIGSLDDQNDQNGGDGGGSSSPLPSSAMNPNANGRAGLPGSTITPPSSSSGADTPSEIKPRAPITAQTKGVIGIPNLKMTTTAANSNTGSLLSSDKNNVRIESGTLMLLRVN